MILVLAMAAYAIAVPSGFAKCPVDLSNPAAGLIGGKHTAKDGNSKFSFVLKNKQLVVSSKDGTKIYGMLLGTTGFSIKSTTASFQAMTGCTTTSALSHTDNILKTAADLTFDAAVTSGAMKASGYIAADSSGTDFYFFSSDVTNSDNIATAGTPVINNTTAASNTTLPTNTTTAGNTTVADNVTVAAMNNNTTPAPGGYGPKKGKRCRSKKHHKQHPKVPATNGTTPVVNGTTTPIVNGTTTPVVNGTTTANATTDNGITSMKSATSVDLVPTATGGAAVSTSAAGNVDVKTAAASGSATATGTATGIPTATVTATGTGAAVTGTATATGTGTATATGSGSKETVAAGTETANTGNTGGGYGYLK